MSHEDFLEPDEMDVLREQFKLSTEHSALPKMDDLPNLDLLLETKAKTDRAIAEYAESLREQLHRLDSVERRQITDGSRQQRGGLRPPSISTADSHLRSIVSRLTPYSYHLTPLFCILFGIAIGSAVVCYLPSAVSPTPPTIQPAEETLKEFVAREAERLLTADERRKLITVTEKILQQDFTRPSAIVEEFTLQRRIAGVNSPAFNAFSDKWAAKVEKMQTDTVEAMREIYRSLLRGLKMREVRSQELEDRREEIETESHVDEVEREVSGMELLPSNSSLLTPSPEKPTVRRQRLFR